MLLWPLALELAVEVSACIRDGSQRIYTNVVNKLDDLFQWSENQVCQICVEGEGETDEHQDGRHGEENAFGGPLAGIPPDILNHRGHDGWTGCRGRGMRGRRR